MVSKLSEVLESDDPLIEILSKTTSLITGLTANSMKKEATAYLVSVRAMQKTRDFPPSFH